MICTEQGSGGTHIADAHGRGAGQSAEFTEGINLHGTGKREQDICRNVHSIGEKADDKEQEELTEQDGLSPVNAGTVFMVVSDPLGQIYADYKRKHGQQIMKGACPLARGKILSKQYDISRLCIGKDLSAAIVGIGILKSTGKRQKDGEQQGV